MLNRRPLPKELSLLHHVRIDLASSSPAPLLFLGSPMPLLPLFPIFLMLHKYIFKLAHASVETRLHYRTKFFVMGGEALKLNRRPFPRELQQFRSTCSSQ